jgi:hypothetical protein
MSLKKYLKYHRATVLLLLLLFTWKANLTQVHAQIKTYVSDGRSRVNPISEYKSFSTTPIGSVAPETSLVASPINLLRLSQSQTVTSPLQSSGLTPLWQEQFTDGSIDRMQFTWAKGFNDALSSFVIPGAVYLGKDGATPFPWVEQEINNFKAYQGEPLPSTLEFDVFSPYNKVGRLSLRPRRRGDFAHMYIGYPNNSTSIQFKFKDSGTVISYNERTGPAYGWTHLTVSYRQFLSGTVTYAQYIIAINEEIHEYTGPSGITNPDWVTHWNTTSDADGWSIEHTSSEDVMGKYIANVRAYSGFLTQTQMQNRLQGRVRNYLAQLPDPRNYNGSKKLFQVHKDLELYGPNALAYAQQIAPLRVKLDGSLSSSWGKITSYNWNFGDGQTGSGRIVNHTYAQAGTYLVKLTVSNKYGSESHQITVTVNDSNAVADLALTKARMGIGVVMPGQPITYQLTVANAGPKSPVTAMVVNTFDNATAIVDISGPGCSWTKGSEQITCTVTGINKITPKVLTLVVTTTSTFSGNLSSTAVVQPTNAFDNDTANNSAGPIIVAVGQIGSSPGAQTLYLPLIELAEPQTR